MVLLLLFILSILVPPLVIVIKKDELGDNFLAHLAVNILLCFCAWIPAVIHAWVVALTK